MSEYYSGKTAKNKLIAPDNDISLSGAIFMYIISSCVERTICSYQD